MENSGRKKKLKEEKDREKFRPSTVVIILVFAAGIGLILYPTVSGLYNQAKASKAITQYNEAALDLSEEEIDALLKSAHEYNTWLFKSGHGLGLDEDEFAKYESQLSVPGTDVIGYVEIEKIDVYLPIYHGTGTDSLAHGAGHLEGSSLPVGGISTHCVLSAHRGLVSAKLFTYLDELEIGDTFVIYVLDQKLTYEVDQIVIVEPDDVSELEIVEGEDYCTLLTCTPYGINSHRLLVRGHRIPNAEEAKKEEGSDNLLLLICCITALLIAVNNIILILLKRRKERKCS